MYLAVPFLLSMLRNNVVDVYIVVLHRVIKKIQPSFVQELITEFSKRKRWRTFRKDNPGVDKAVHFVLGLTSASCPLRKPCVNLV